MAAPGSIDFHMDIDTTDLEGTLARLDTALSPAGLSVFLTGVVAPWIRERAENRFMNEGDDVVGKWAPLMPATQEIRGRGDWGVGPAHPINRRTGDLEEYITRSNTSVIAAADSALLIYPDTAPSKPGLKAKVETAQKGKSRPKTPARPVLGVNERDLVFVMQSLSTYIQGVV